MAAYDKKASGKVEAALHAQKLGKLKSGTSGDKVTSRKQAIAIALSEARKEGDKVPEEADAAKQGRAGGSATKKASAGKAGAKTAAKKSPARKE